MRPNIIWVDMHIRDERAFTWIQHQSKNGIVALKRAELAKHLGCHDHTASAILRRLVGAGMLEIEARRHRCYVYRVTGSL